MGGQALSSFDYLAACLIVVGMICQLFHRRLPAGLGTSLLVGATTVGIWMAASNHTWALARVEYLWLRLTAGLCLTWAFFGWLAAEPLKGRGRDGSSAPTFFAWALVTGIGAIVQAVYVLVFNTWYRLIEPESGGEGLLPKGSLIDLAFILLAVLLWRGTARRPAQPAMMLCLSALIIWWTSLTIQATFGIYGERQSAAGRFRPSWWDWTFHMQFSLAWLLAAAAVIQDAGYRARRKAAWPDRLDDLLAPYSRWPAYIQVESIIAAVVLVLGVYQLVIQEPASIGQGLASSLACLAVGMTCIFMTYRRWSGNTSGLGMSLLSLGIVILCSTASSLFMSDRLRADYSARMVVALNAMLFGMAIVIAWWSWLAHFWKQQLLDEVPWTTAGRMIPLANRLVFFVGSLTVLIALEMALWPRLAAVEIEDRSMGRVIAGCLAMFLLATVFIRQARRDHKPALAGLAVAIVFLSGLFLYVRMPSSPSRGWIQQHDSVVLSCLALPILTLAEALPRTSWRVLAGPLWLLALLVLPFFAIVELRRPPLPADWVQPLVLAVLGALYSFAGSREHRRMLLFLGGTLLFASLTSVYRAYF